jgi:hypothetical protein
VVALRAGSENVGDSCHRFGRFPRG